MSTELTQEEINFINKNFHKEKISLNGSIIESIIYPSSLKSKEKSIVKNLKIKLSGVSKASYGVMIYPIPSCFNK